MRVIRGFLLFVMVLLGSSSIVYSADFYGVPQGSTIEIDEHGECRDVTGQALRTVFVPTRTSFEWIDRFIPRVPSNIATASNCAPPVPFCGDGNVDPGEECEDATSPLTSTCDAEGLPGGTQTVVCNPITCQWATAGICVSTCGNGIVEAGEVCDGTGISCSISGLSGSAPCNGACTGYGACTPDPFCGDGTINQPSEECDDGNDNNFDSCSNTCQDQIPGTCGDGNIDTLRGEVCDGSNLGGETCQSQGFASGNLACSSSCTFNIGGCTNDIPCTCGDGIVECTEECDDGNSDNGDACSNTCQSQVCGDGTIQTAAGEQCDGSNLGGQSCTSLGFILGGSLACNPSTCQYDITNCNTGCGDGFWDQFGTQGAVEQCDDGNLNSNDGCSNLCEIEYCGDGVVQPNVFGEQCDDGNINNGDGCSSTCQNEGCGDGTLQPSELCEVGDTIACAVLNPVAYDGGTANCIAPPTANACGAYDESTCNRVAECGDGNLDPGEQCEPGQLNGQTCVSQGFPSGGTLSCNPTTCQYETSSCFVCGNGVTEGNEACDGQICENVETIIGATGTGVCNFCLTLEIRADQCKVDCSGYEPMDPADAFSMCYTPGCGNGLPDPGEDCEPGDTIACSTLGLTGTGDATCNPATCGWDTSACTASCGNGVVEDGEVCEPGDTNVCPNGNTGSQGTCLSDCSGYDYSTCSLCGNGIIEFGEACDGEVCIDAGVGNENGQGGALYLTCNNDCTLLETDNTCGSICGNGVREGSEVCDGGSDVCPIGGGSAPCNAQCTGYDYSGCSTCGNGQINAGEQCDGSNLNGATCQSLGFGSGSLSCTSSCNYDTSSCGGCGNGVVDPGEQCDGNPNVCTYIGPPASETEGIICNNCRINGCTLPPSCSCGNGIVESSCGEVCDGGSLSCAALGQPGGQNAQCNSACTGYDISVCSNPAVCGNGVVEGSEVCDSNSIACSALGLPGTGNGVCNSACTGYDTSACTNVQYAWRPRGAPICYTTGYPSGNSNLNNPCNAGSLGDNFFEYIDIGCGGVDSPGATFGVWYQEWRCQII